MPGAVSLLRLVSFWLHGRRGLGDRVRLLVDGLLLLLCRAQSRQCPLRLPLRLRSLWRLGIALRFPHSRLSVSSIVFGGWGCKGTETILRLRLPECLVRHLYRRSNRLLMHEWSSVEMRSGLRLEIFE